MCIDRQSDAINYLSQKISFDDIMTFIRHKSVPDDMRASFCKLLNNLYIDRQPRERLNLNQMTFYWNLIPDKVNKSFKNLIGANTGEFQVIKDFIEQYLQRLVTDEKSFEIMVSSNNFFKNLIILLLYGFDSCKTFVRFLANH